jgi:HlyD family secretion protein
VGLSKLKPAPPSVDRGTVVIDTVKRGPLNRNVPGLGTLVPEDIRWIAAVTSGRVEKRLVQQGTKVSPDTVLLELSNPELDQSVMEAESQLNSALAEYQNKEWSSKHSF